MAADDAGNVVGQVVMGGRGHDIAGPDSGNDSFIQQVELVLAAKAGNPSPVVTAPA